MRERGQRVYKTKTNFTPGGRWLDGMIVTLWEQSRLRFLEETRCIAEKTLDYLLYRSDYHPHAATLRRLAAAIAQRQRDRGDTPVDESDVLARWMTWEEGREGAAPSLPRCPVCGRQRKSDKTTCSGLCAILRAFLKPKLRIRTPGGKWLWAVCAASADVPPPRIAALLEIPLQTVQAWLGTPGVREAIVRIQQERGQSAALLRPVARILGMSMNALHTYLTGRYQGKRLRYGRYVCRLAELMGRGEDECAKAFEVDVFEAYPRVGARRRWWPKGRPVASCDLTRRIHSHRVKGHSDGEIPVLLAKEAEDSLRREGKSDEEIGSALPKTREANLTLKEVYWLPIQHARVCRSEKCVRSVACDLKARGLTVRHIVKPLRKSSREVERALQREREHIPVFAYGSLTVTEAARLWGKSPRHVRAMADSGVLRATRTPGGWRAFDSRSFPPAH